MKYSLVYSLGIVLLLPCICASLAGDDDVSNTNSSYSRCPNSFNVLERALYETEGNMVKMLVIFSPARKTPPSLVRVHYAFKEENGAISNCTVQYLWVEGGFLFVQPPTIFQLSSLLFYFKGFRHEDEFNLYLTLPFECRPLIVEDEDGICTCQETNSSVSLPLEKLTEQLRAYAKYGSPENVEREIATPSHAICENRLKNRYYAETESSNSFKVHIVLLLLPFLPLMFIALVGSIIRSVNRKIHSKLVDPKNYSSTAGIVLTGMFLSFFIFSCDILAVYYATSGKHEYDEDHVSNSLNILIIWVIFGLDLIVCIIPLTVLLYICYEHVNEEHVSEVSVKNYRCKLLKNYVFPFIFEAYVNAVFGDQEQFCKTEKTENKAEAQNTDMLWRVSCAAIAPLFMIPSHIIFILAAWLTDPPRASSIALVAIGIFLYFFLLFRQCYTINKNFKTKCHCWSLFLPLYPIWAFFKFVYIIFCSKICRKVKEKRVECRKKKDCEEGTKEESRLLLEASRKLDETKHFGEKDGGNLKSPVAGNEQNKENGEEGESSNGKEGESSNGKEGESSNGKEGESSNGKEGESSNGKEGESSNGKVGESSKSDTLFNTKAFCIAFAWGWVFLGCLTLFFSALMELPISVFGLPSYLLNIFQVLIVVISMLITYKILSGEAPDMHKFMISAQFAYNEKTKGTKDEDEIEAGGSMFGELAGVVVQKYNQKP